LNFRVWGLIAFFSCEADLSLLVMETISG